MSDITVRNAALADAPRILEIYAYYVEHTVITFEYDVPSLAEFEDRTVLFCFSFFACPLITP